MEQQRPASNVPSPEAPLAKMVAEALALSRIITRLNPLEYALRMSLALRRQVTASEVIQAETGASSPAADYLVASGLVAETAVSFLLGEWEYDGQKLDQLEQAVRSLL